MGRRVVVLGVGGMGREAAAWLTAGDPDAALIGFLDDDPAHHGRRVGDLDVLGGMDWLAGHRDIEVVVAVGSPAVRTRLVQALDAADVSLCSVVHPAATVGPRVELEPGVIIGPGVVLTCDIRVGRAAILNYGAKVGHDGRIGPCAFLAPGVHLGGNVTVGSQADIGIGASVIQGIAIGRAAVVGAGAAVIRDVPDETTVVGVPARPLPPRR